VKKYIYSSILVFSILHGYEVDDFSNLSLEELMNIPVSSASRREEKQNLAPGVVSIVTSKEMQKYGARHLRDVLDRVVGMQIIGSHHQPHSKASIRGVNSSQHEGHVLILLNGRPVRQGTSGGINTDFYLGFPINIIDHIEIIRGPGSVIYGSNAVAGIVNIITKDGDDFINETRVDLGFGTHSRQQAQVSTLVGDTDYSLNVGLNYIYADGDTIEGLVDTNRILGDYKTGEKSKNIVVNARYKNLTLNTMFMESGVDYAKAQFQFPSDENYAKRSFFDIGYKQDIVDGWDASFNYTTSHETRRWQVNKAVSNALNGHSDLLEMIVHGNVNDDLNILIGANYVRNESGFNRGLPKGSVKASNSLYTQVDYMLNDKQKIIAGVQWNKPRGVDSDLSYRTGFIQGFGANTWLKLLYSEAYRSPNLVETNLDAPLLKGNPLLDPEKIYTYDIQLTHQTGQTFLAINLYHSRLKNLIVRLGTTPPTQANAGHVDFHGIELEGRYEYDENLNFIGNFSYQENETDQGVKQTTFAPETMAKIGFTYTGVKGMTISGFNSYIGESTDLGEVTNDPSINVNEKADSYNLLTANIVMDLGVLFKSSKMDKSYLSVYLDNLLDEDIYAPDLNFNHINNTIPHHWGRGVYGTFTYKF